MKLYYHPISSYSQKAMMAFYEKGAQFEPSLVNLMDPASRAKYLEVNPLGKVPFLRVESEDRNIPESTIIIEYIDRHCPGGARLIPDDPDLARQVRFRDRFMDLYVNEMVTKIYFDGTRPEGKRDPYGVELAHQRLETSLGILERVIAGKTWAMGEDFSMADCAAAPALFYCRMIHPFGDRPNVTAYAQRLSERPSYQRVLAEAAPYLEKMRAK